MKRSNHFTYDMLILSECMSLPCYLEEFISNGTRKLSLILLSVATISYIYFSTHNFND